VDSHLADFFRLILKSPPKKPCFNPWAEVDTQNDIGPGAPGIRKKHLKHYLEARLKSARYVLIGEALSYQGGHFTGIPMTSERILLGFKAKQGIHPEDVLPGLTPQRTSKPGVIVHGFNEPTATIVWTAIAASGREPNAFALWNVFPWHPFNPAKGLLSNRKPTEEEVASGLGLLSLFLEVFPETSIIALGRVAAQALHRLSIDFHPVRHPARGGALLFRKQFLTKLKTDRKRGAEK
jgi:hypothetical protein